MLDKTYDPSTVEGRIYQQWTDAGAFACGRQTSDGKPAASPAEAPAGRDQTSIAAPPAGRDQTSIAAPYCIVIPPPNVTGSLHMGHALNNTLQDVLVRFERMRGKDVLWQPGLDHAGIATQMIVERQLAERQQPGRRDMGREAFIKRVWEWKGESGGTIIGQLKRLGASCDWERERFTMDEGLSRAVLKVFVELYRQGLIYKDKRLVNWDPKLQTAISDLEVENVEVKGNFWHFRYPLADGQTVRYPTEFDEDGKPVAWEDCGYIVVATTRPETMLGDTAVAVNAEDERYKHLAGAHVVLPLVGRRIPIVFDEHADPEQGSGAVKITPAHDFNDFEVGRRHNLPMINILTPDGKLNGEVPEAYRGLDRFDARKQVVADIDALGLLDRVEPRTVMVPHDEKSKMTVIEPYLTDQWYVDAKTLAKPAIEAVEQGKTVFVPKNWEKTYFEWLRNIQPWCISRQLWWGHQIPAWYGPDGEMFVAYDEAEVARLAKKHYGKAVELRRDPDVLDTWFSSALWAFSTLGWPDETPELARYYPTSVLVTGFDIIFFWVARMMMMGLHFMKEVPFHTVYIHALVRDEKGQKMSKTKGNVMDPLDIIDGCDLDTLIMKRTRSLPPDVAKRIAADTRKSYPQGIAAYGADALRFTMAALAAQGRDVKLSMQVVEGYRNFSTKLWNAARFGEMNGCTPVKGFNPAKAKATVNRWIAGEMQRTVSAVTAGIEQHRYNEAAAAAYQFVWHTFCDWYLELAKPVLSGPDGAEKTETRAMFAWAFDHILMLLHPFMPFITEELWGRIGEAAGGRDALLMLAPWPQLSGLEDEAADHEAGWIMQLVTEVRSVRSEMNVPPGAQIPLVICGAGKDVAAWAARHRDTVAKMARLSSVELQKTPPKGAVQIVTHDGVLALPLAGIIDVQAEGERLKREISRMNDEVQKLDVKLSDKQFAEKAPEHVVEENRERRNAAAATAKRLAEALKRLEAAT